MYLLYIYTYIEYLHTHTVHPAGSNSSGLPPFRICNSPPTVRKTWLPLPSIYLLNPLCVTVIPTIPAASLASSHVRLQGKGREREGREGRRVSSTLQACPPLHPYFPCFSRS